MKRLFLLLNLVLISFLNKAQVSVEIDVTPYGSLSNALLSTGVDPNTVSELKVIGNINMWDFFYMNDQMAQLSKIDLNYANITDMMPGGCFSGNQKLTWIALPPYLQEIYPFTFKDCINLEWVYLPYSLKKIGDFAFSGCTRLHWLESFSFLYSFPESLTEIGNEAFANCSALGLGDLVFPPNLNTIGSGAFSNTIKWGRTLKIPISVTTISTGAFCGCSFNQVIVENPVPFSIGSYPFCEMYSESALIVPKGVVNAYRAASNWSNFVTIIEPIVISYDSQGGTAVASNFDVIYNDFLWKPAEPTRVNYIFGGWYKEPSCINKWDFDYQRVKGSMTLYAKWYNPINTVSFNSNGGSNVLSVSANFNTTITIPTVPTKVGYTFGGWCKDSELITFWNFTTDKVLENTTLYAKWIVNSYTVSFDTQGGSAVASITANYNTTIVEPLAPTNTGYTFGGWYRESGLTTPWSFAADRVTDNTTLYAKWTINSYTVTFNAQGGSSVSNITANYNTTIVEPLAPTKTGYTFCGWYRELGLTTPWSFAADRVTENTTLYAKWSINSYTVTFDAQGGSAVANITAEYNTTICEPSAPTKTGYTFSGWYRESGLTNPWSFAADRVTENTTLYANWTINSYTVTFDAQGGSAVASISANYNTTIVEPLAPTKTGYTFGGWYRELGLTSPWSFAADRVTDNTALYAKWTINSYTVTFDAQGGSAVANITAEYNTTISEPSAPTKTGYTFGGWYRESGLATLWNFAVDKVISDMVLYAKWEISSSIDDLSKSNYKLYPNPTLDYVNIECDNIDEICIVNMQGKVLKNIAIRNNNVNPLYVGDLLLGNYIVMLKTKDGRIVNIKLIKN